MHRGCNRTGRPSAPRSLCHILPQKDLHGSPCAHQPHSVGKEGPFALADLLTRHEWPEETHHYRWFDFALGSGCHCSMAAPIPAYRFVVAALQFQRLARLLPDSSIAVCKRLMLATHGAVGYANGIRSTSKPMTSSKQLVASPQLQLVTAVACGLLAHLNTRPRDQRAIRHWLALDNAHPQPPRQSPQSLRHKSSCLCCLAERSLGKGHDNH